MRRAVLALGVVLFLGGTATAGPQIGPVEHCERPAQHLSYWGCVSAGQRWAVVGGPGDDRLVGYAFNDVIHSGKGTDFINGKAGYDVCYVQPTDTVKNCEEEV